MKTLYFDCGSGISGDMIVGALLDLGADEQVMRKALSGLSSENVKIVTERVMKNALDCCNFDVVLDDEHDNHDHDMEYLFGHEGGHDDHAHGDHHHTHRNLTDVLRIIDSLEMTPSARKLAGRVFEILAEAEGKAHGKDMHEVHFHEVGALDSIADIVAAAVCFDNLGIERVIIPKLCEGTGTVRCAHGILPIPVPAVMNVASMYGLPIAITDRQAELITPTGAAFAAAVMTGVKLPESFIPLKVGLGAGKRAYKYPSILRAVIIDSDENGPFIESDHTDHHEKNPKMIFTRDMQTDDIIWKLETNIDDCTGEQMGFALELLLKNGARDAFYTPVFMKKNRPAWLLTVICEESNIPLMEDIIFKNTTTIGIRRQMMKRTILPRRTETVKTEYGEIKVKVCTYNGEEKAYPEYESAVAIARREGCSLGEIYKAAEDAYKKTVG
ncbi:MAG: nickel pincer cofactor biosynthesis protein LarC [Lachnospiraceae bacterium]|nr:nickel pincer cofactor biosynthesis protein LarC [Lachnospiraceae bacterium]